MTVVRRPRHPGVDQMSRRIKILLSVLLAIVVAIAVALWILPGKFEEALRAEVNAYIRERTLAMLNEKDVSGLNVDFESLDLSLAQRHLIINGIRIRYDHRDDSTGYVRFTAETPRVSLLGLDIGDVIKHESFRLDEVRIERPVLSQLRELGPKTKAPKGQAREPGAVRVTEEDSITIAAPVELDTLLYHAVAAWLPDEIRQARIDRIAFNDASILSVTKRGKAVTRDSLGNFTVDIRGLGLDSLKRRVFEGVSVDLQTALHVSPSADSVQIDTVAIRLDPKDTVLTLRRARSTPSNPEKSALFLEGMRRSNSEQKLQLDTLTFGPRISDKGWLARATKRRSRIRLNLGKLEVQGALLRRALGERVELQKIAVGSMTLDVLADRRAEKTPPKPRSMWSQRLADLDWAVRVDTISLKKGTIRYGEVNAGRPEVALLYFSDVNALVTKVGNKEGFGKNSVPVAVIDATAKLMGKGAVRTHIEVPQQTGSHISSVSGSLGKFPGTELNSMLLYAAGVKLKSGVMDTVNFNFKVANGLSTGGFSATFDSLSLEIMNRVSQKKGLKEKLMGKVANALVRNSNKPGEKSYRPEVPIKYELKNSDSFWGMVWQSIKAGLLKMMKD
jgi:hypothetical protein